MEPDSQFGQRPPEADVVSEGGPEPEGVVRGGVLRGRAYDNATGKGIAGVVVWAQAEGDDGPRVDSDPTDPDGFYEIVGLAEAQYRVQRTTPEGYREPPYHDRRLVTMKTPMKLSRITKFSSTLSRPSPI